MEAQTGTSYPIPLSTSGIKSLPDCVTVIVPYWKGGQKEIEVELN